MDLTPTPRPGQPFGPLNNPTGGRGARRSGVSPLRLVDDQPATDPKHRRAATKAATRAVTKENARAAALSDDDARQLLAIKATQSLEGGRSAILRPEARRGLVDHAGKMGLRAFDANLVIAIVQDAARRGEGLNDIPTQGRLNMVGGPKAGSKPASKNTPPHNPDHTPLMGPVLIGLLIATLWLAALFAWALGYLKPW